MGKVSNTIPIELSKALAKSNGGSTTARSLSTSVTKDGFRGYYKLQRAGKHKQANKKAGFLTMTVTKNTQRRLRRAATMLGSDLTDLVRASVHTTLPIMEKVAKQLVKEEKQQEKVAKMKTAGECLRCRRTFA